MARQAASQPSVIRAQRIEIVDGQGRVRIALQAEGSLTGTATISLRDRQERERMLLAVLSDGSSEIVFRDPQEFARLWLQMLSAGSSEIQIKDSKGQVLFRAP
jgi:hypothetical protein